MTISVKFFAGLRETLDLSNTHLDADGIRNAHDVWVQATDNAPVPENTLCAINLDHIEWDHPVTDGDEVAFFPPVTGG
ncbi:MAG: MoaD/ThiS family protein [Pseudomonadota bacterium]